MTKLEERKNFMNHLLEGIEECGYITICFDDFCNLYTYEEFLKELDNYKLEIDSRNSDNYTIVFSDEHYTKRGTVNFKGLKIGVVFYIDKNDYDSSELKFLHVMTNQECGKIEQALQGWSEQNEEDNKQWNEFKSRIEEEIETITDALSNNETEIILD